MDAPIGLQLASPRWQDERLMAALRVVEKVLPLSG
jgi:Asp-tRNA(Asn)/Glu-tRNA(Gln) amidotransferase A subunit family amidase